MIDNIKWLGHDTFKIIGEKIIYTDPYQIKTQDEADIILITHDHYDHFSPEDIEKLLGPNTVLVLPADCSGKINAKEVILKPGDKIEIEGIEIEGVPSYNTNKNFHPKEKGWLGFIFKVSGKRIYLAGDTDYIPEMKSFSNIDIALLPVSGTYVMSADEAVQAALDIKPKLAIPMHYGSIVGSEKDAIYFAEKLKGKIDVVILRQEN